MPDQRQISKEEAARRLKQRKEQTLPDEHVSLARTYCILQAIVERRDGWEDGGGSQDQSMPRGAKKRCPFCEALLVAPHSARMVLAIWRCPGVLHSLIIDIPLSCLVVVSEGIIDQQCSCCSVRPGLRRTGRRTGQAVQDGSVQPTLPPTSHGRQKRIRSPAPSEALSRLVDGGNEAPVRQMGTDVLIYVSSGTQTLVCSPKLVVVCNNSLLTELHGCDTAS